MIGRLRKNKLLILIILSSCLYLLSLLITLSDPQFSLRWFILLLWVISILTIPLYLFITNTRNIKLKKLKADRLLILIFLLSFSLNFFALKDYPFVSIYDQVRDGGINAAQILDGTIKNIFSYGRYSSHGLTIPTITSFFYYIFGNSVFTFRIPAALFTVFSSLVIYITLRKFDRNFAFFSSLIFTTLPLTLYYARTEVVVVFSTFLFSLMILFLSKFIKNRDYVLYILGGILLGFSSTFHPSIRTMSLFIFVLITVMTIFNLYTTKKLKRSIISLSLLSLFFLIGFGPRLLFTTSDIFFQTRSLEIADSNGLEIVKIGGNYIKSLLVYITEPTISTHYPDFKPVLSPVAALFFLLGIIFSLIKKDKFMVLMVLFAFVIPFTNSAITDTINSDNRFGPLFVSASILAGFGIYSIINRLKNKNVKNVFGFVIFIIFILQAINFFSKEPAAKQYQLVDYLSQHTIYSIKSDPGLMSSNKICLSTNPVFLDYSKLYHVQEQFQYFLPNKYIYIYPQENIARNEIFISKECGDIEKNNYQKISICAVKEKFICPKNPINIYKETKAGNRSRLNDNIFIIKPSPAFIP